MPHDIRFLGKAPHCPRLLGGTMLFCLGDVMPDQATILLVEDQEDDIFMITHAFERGCIANPLRVVRDGEEAIAYLHGDGIFADRGEFPMPGLVLLDLE